MDPATATLILGIINLLMNWLNTTPASQGGPTKEELDAVDAKWQAARAKWNGASPKP